MKLSIQWVIILWSPFHARNHNPCLWSIYNRLHKHVESNHKRPINYGLFHQSAILIRFANLSILWGQECKMLFSFPSCSDWFICITQKSHEDQHCPSKWLSVLQRLLKLNWLYNVVSSQIILIFNSKWAVSSESLGHLITSKLFCICFQITMIMYSNVYMLLWTCDPWPNHQQKMMSFSSEPDQSIMVFSSMFVLICLVNQRR